MSLKVNQIPIFFVNGDAACHSLDLPEQPTDEGINKVCKLLSLVDGGNPQFPGEQDR